MSNKVNRMLLRKKFEERKKLMMSGQNMRNVVIGAVAFVMLWTLSDGSPVAKYAPTLTSPSALQLQQQQQQQHQHEKQLQLAKPSRMTFNLGKCVADVSLEYIICRNLSSRSDLPKKQPSFNGIQQATFVYVSGDGKGDIRLEDFKSLFPNLVSLSITHSPGSAASLINLQKTGSSSQFRMRESLVPKSLLQDPLFAKRFNLNYFSSASTSSNGNGNSKSEQDQQQQQKTTQSLQPKQQMSAVGEGESSGRGERALISQEEKEKSDNKKNNLLLFTGESSTTTAFASKTKTSTEASAPGNERQRKKSLGAGEDYINDMINVDSPSMEETNDIFLPNPSSSSGDSDNNDNESVQMDDGSVVSPPPMPEPPHKLRRLVWPSVQVLDLSFNELSSEMLPDFLENIFPNLVELNLANNYLTTLDRVKEADWTGLEKIDISGNPLDCTNLEWIEDWINSSSITLLRENDTLCDKPSHQNKAKPMFKVLHLLKKLRKECRVCTCDIVYIWEQNHVIHSKTVVNCSSKGLTDFPDPDHLPKPTDTLDLRDNKITNMSTFVKDSYLNLNIMNLYLDDNQISSINSLEGCDWLNQCQFFSIRRNHLTEVPVYVLENAFRQNSRLYKIDLSGNKFNCDCFTVSSFKVWLLRYANNIDHIEDVRCASTNEQIRYMRTEQWCTADNGTQFIHVLDIVSIVLAILIVAVVSKVYYDYWNFKNKGKLPWLVGKM